MTVEHITTRGAVDYYRVSAGRKGGPQVTVRVGFHGVFACLTCNVATCAHARAAEDFARGRAPSATAATVSAAATHTAA